MIPDRYAPTPKMAAAGLAGAGACVLVWLVSLLGVSMPPEVAAALTTLLTFAAGWATRDASSPGTARPLEE